MRRVLRIHCIAVSACCTKRRNSSTIGGWESTSLHQLYGVGAAPSVSTTALGGGDGHAAVMAQRDNIAEAISDTSYAGSNSPLYVQRLARKMVGSHLNILCNVPIGRGALGRAGDAGCLLESIQQLGATAADDSTAFRRLIALTDIIVLGVVAHRNAYRLDLTLAVTLWADTLRLVLQAPVMGIRPDEIGKLASIVVAAAAVDRRVPRSVVTALRVAFQHRGCPDLATAYRWLSQTGDAPGADTVLALLASLTNAENVQAAGITAGTKCCRDAMRRYAANSSSSSSAISTISRAYASACMHMVLAARGAQLIAQTVVDEPASTICCVEALFKVWPMLVALSSGTSVITAVCQRVAESSNTVNAVRAWQVLREHMSWCGDPTNKSAAAVDDILEHATPQELRAARFTARHTKHSRSLRLVSTDASWQAALENLVERMSTEDPAAEPWRHSAPQAIQALTNARRYTDAIRLFDEYSTMVCGVDVWSTDVPHVLNIEAVSNFARAVAKTSRWYRALDIVTAVGYCKPGVSDDVSSIWRLTAEAVRSNWEAALALLVTLHEHRAPRAALDACVPYALEAVSKMHKGGDGNWIRALNGVQTYNTADVSQRSVAAVESNIGILAWLRPCLAYRLASHVLSNSRRGDFENEPHGHPWSCLPGGVEALRPKHAAVVDIVSRQFARHGHWMEAIGLALGASTSISGDDALRKGLWERVAAALQHHHLADDAVAPDGTVLQQCLQAGDAASYHRPALRGLLRASGNHGWIVQYADALEQLSSQQVNSPQLTEYTAWAKLLRAATVADWADVARRLPLTLTDTFLVHAACTAPWITLALAQASGVPQRHSNRHGVSPTHRSPCAVVFEWTKETLELLHTTCGSDVEYFAEHILQVSPHQLLAKDVRCLASRPPEIGDPLRIVPLTVSDELPLPFAAQNAFVVSSSSGAVLAAKPAGWAMERFSVFAQMQCVTRALVPLYKLQPLAQGIVVLVPLDAPKVRYHVTIFILLGLRRIVADAVALTSTKCYSKYSLRLVHAVDEGLLLSSSEVVVVEAVCQSNTTHGPPGTLYDLSMDLALEGWGYCGDAGNAHDERAMDHSIKGGAREASSRSEDAPLDGRALFLVREVIVRMPRGDGTSARVLSAEIPVPKWWHEIGLLEADEGPPERTDQSEEFTTDLM